MHRRLSRWTVPGLLVTNLAALSAAAPAPSASFSLILERDGTEWSATCESGCDWATVGSKRPRIFGTSIVIDSYGVAGLLGSPHDDASFAFKVSGDGDNGWKAEGLKGTAWTKLTYGCEDGPCRARVTQAGVEGIERGGDS
jgi:hypothetical protein